MTVNVSSRPGKLCQQHVGVHPTVGGYLTKSALRKYRSLIIFVLGARACSQFYSGKISPGRLLLAGIKCLADRTAEAYPSPVGSWKSCIHCAQETEQAPREKAVRKASAPLGQASAQRC